MKRDDPNDLSSLSLTEIYQVESENQIAIITSGLLELERNPDSTHQLEALMRAAHSLKGAAQIINHQTAVDVAHAIEDCFVAAQQAKLHLRQQHIDLLFQGLDLLLRISERPEVENPQEEAAHASQAGDFFNGLG